MANENLYDFTEISISQNQITFLRYYNDSLFIVSTILEIFHAWVILKCTTPEMKLFRRTMLAFCFICFLMELIAVLLKPLILAPFNIVLITGYIKSFNPKCAKICFISLNLILSILVEQLFVILSQRYFKINFMAGNNRHKFYRKLLFSFLFGTLGLANIGFGIIVYEMEETEKILLKINNFNFDGIINSNSILLQIPLLNLKSYILLSFVAFYALFRYFWVTFVLYKNYKAKKNKKQSKNLNLQYSTVFRTRIVQVSTTFIFSSFYIVLYYGILFPIKNSTNMFYYMYCLILWYPIFHIITITIFVKTYRKVCIHFINKCLCHQKNKLNVTVIAPNTSILNAGENVVNVRTLK